MDTASRFSPSARDFQVYQRVTLEGATTRQAAADFSLSQTRVRQIVKAVAAWLAESLPKPTETEDAAYLRLAQHIAADRLQFLYGEAMHGWRATHQAKYAGVILRITAALGKMPVSPGTLDALAADALEGPLSDDYVIREGEAPAEPPTAGPSTFDLRRPTPQSPPPPGDCSTSTQKSPDAVATPPEQATASLSTATILVDRPDDRAAARLAFLTRAQSSGGTGILPVSAAPADPYTPITELKLTPQKLGLSIQKKLSRRERRKLRRKVGR